MACDIWCSCVSCSPHGYGDVWSLLWYRLAGVKGQGMVLLMTDTQIVDDRFLVFVNDMLSSGWVKGLFEKDEMDGVFQALRNEAKSAGIPDSSDSMFEFFLSRILRNLHIVLCFSPVGDTFRIRSRRFPGLCNCTSIDWFHRTCSGCASLCHFLPCLGLAMRRVVDRIRLIFWCPFHCRIYFEQRGHQMRWKVSPIVLSRTSSLAPTPSRRTSRATWHNCTSASLTSPRTSRK